MIIINEGESVQAIEHRDGYRFFVENDIEDDIFIIFIPHLALTEAENYARAMSIAWDEAIKFMETNND